MLRINGGFLLVLLMGVSLWLIIFGLILWSNTLGIIGVGLLMVSVVAAWMRVIESNRRDYKKIPHT